MDGLPTGPSGSDEARLALEIDLDASTAAPPSRKSYLSTQRPSIGSLARGRGRGVGPPAGAAGGRA